MFDISMFVEQKKETRQDNNIIQASIFVRIIWMEIGRGIVGRIARCWNVNDNSITKPNNNNHKVVDKSANQQPTGNNLGIELIIIWLQKNHEFIVKQMEKNILKCITYRETKVSAVDAIFVCCLSICIRFHKYCCYDSVNEHTHTERTDNKTSIRHARVRCHFLCIP